MHKISVLAIALLLLACQEEAKQTQKEHYAEILVSGEAQGTTYTVKYIGEEHIGLKDELDSLLEAIDNSMSTYLATSTISKLNQSDSVSVDSMFENVFNMSMRANLLTGGAFDPSLGPLFKAWGFDYSVPTPMDSAMVDSLLEFCGMNQFILVDGLIKKRNQSASLNFNAIAQGYAVDLMAAVLRRHGLENFYVELGGELKVRGHNSKNAPWRIGIDKPQGKNLERVLQHIVKLQNKAMATSGNYRNYYEVEGEKYSHTIDPATGFPVKRNILSATVIVSSCAYADALATAFMVMGLDASKEMIEKNNTISAILIYSDEEGNMQSYISEDLNDQIEAL